MVEYRGFERMAKVELGLKRTCLSCDMRFYDFKRRPIICPGCGTEFDPENLLKGRKSRAVPKSATKTSVSDDAADLDETEFDDEDVNVAANKDDDDDITPRASCEQFYLISPDEIPTTTDIRYPCHIGASSSSERRRI